MYLRTILELEEEGVVPRRARIAERLRQSGPTVSQTVARMERDGLLTVEGDRQLHRTDNGRVLAFPGLDGPVVVSRICESVQTDADVLRQLHVAGVDPGARVSVQQERDGVRIDRGDEQIRLPREVASRVFVTVRA